MTFKRQLSSFYFDEFLIFLQIERLCERLQLATRPEDQREAIRALKGYSKVSWSVYLIYLQNFLFNK